ncbi:hypothetical protein, partial [Gordonibacter sp.]|uniref:hypothetical protein n=1 Tax=Gordonibacter sp. TaxID=1968902 RepID=UPI002FCC259E
MPILSASTLARKGLAAKLGRALSCRLTSVVSSAGYGKTTSVVAWAWSLKGVPLAWFLLDVEDCALDRFWLYLTASLRIADKDICHAFDEMRLADDVETMKPALDALLIQIAEYGRDFVLVLEDFHTVHDCDGINECLSYFIKRLPAHAHMIVTSRQALRFPMSKMRVEGTLNEIAEGDLCFSEEETADFFSKMGFRFERDEAAAVHGLTRGWPAGSRLVALLGPGGPASSVVEAAGKAKGSINDYLFEEVLQELPSDLQRFMVRTSAVRSFCLPLVERIVGCPREEAVANLDYLVKNNLFIEKVEREDGEDWYRYHLLLSDMLHTRLARIERSEVDDLLYRARDWFEDNGFLDYVVELSADLGDFEKIRMVIIGNWLLAYMNDNHYSLMRWASFLPDRELMKSPAVCAVLVMPYAVNGEMGKAESCMACALERLHEGEDFLYALCMVQKAYLASFEGDAQSMRHYT